ncbi:GNAT family N-acetyltransferase [Kitasatospora sp. MAP5-34]|uniref:GNAT family N-acetyltransferase n=1 Tax=Kitasatospora sp. MAP5-34 TaxID=3035102 RepID=UPI0024772279|nr:GNAT family N-acetyltransferase [Kitasatospora sp. MAP5-34]MDH6579752.1 RimJ/RimL family protein N-acetyltransferase [Kitasatospora sp. MAP5-34]
MLTDHWPLLELRLTTPRLELRLPSDKELAELAELAAQGVHDPDRMPFSVPWTDLPPRERARSVVQHHWLRLGDWTPGNWALNLAVFEHGRIVGQQTIAARDFATLREVGTGPWLGLRHHGRGLGTEMRTAVLHLAFAGLGAAEATSGAFADNPSSLKVSGKLGYEPDGTERLTVRGRATVLHRLRLSRARWEQHQQAGVRVEGLGACLPLLGLADTTHSP